EMPVHHVDMDAIRARSFRFRHLIAKTREVRRQDGRRKLYRSFRRQGVHYDPDERGACLPAGFSRRLRLMRLLVELSWVSLGSVSLAISGMMRWASCLPSSTPH